MQPEATWVLTDPVDPKGGTEKPVSSLERSSDGPL